MIYKRDDRYNSSSNSEKKIKWGYLSLLQPGFHGKLAPLVSKSQTWVRQTTEFEPLI